MSAAKTEHAYIRGEGGTVFKLDLPLHETIQDKLDKQLVQRVNEDGTPYVEKKSAGSSSGDKPVDKMTAAELKAFAEDNKIDLGEAKLKDDVLAVVQEAIAAREAAKADGGDADDNQ